MVLSGARGKLVIVGGGDDCVNDCVILKEFIRLAKGSRARIVVMTVATNYPEETGPEYVRQFRSLGVDEVQYVDVSKREDAMDETALDAIRQATGVYFTGGDQFHVTTLMGGTPMHALLNERYEKGVVLGGTSAGAAMMSNSMIIEGNGEDNPKFASVEVGPGMDFIIGAIIDTHFSQRGRHGRLLTAVAHYPQDIGFGIDEATAMVVENNVITVIGAGAVTVFDGGAMTYTNLPYVEKEQGFSLYDVRLHVLTEGHRFDLTSRQPIPQEIPTPKEAPAKSAKAARNKESKESGKTGKSKKAAKG